MRIVSRILTLLAIGIAGVAHANGRPPATNGVMFRQDHAEALYVRATFGLLVSTDGCSFRWVCEQSIGYGGDFDPKYAIASDGTIFATTFSGLRVSRDGGCSFSTATAELPPGAPGRIADSWVDALDIGSTGEIWVATANAGAANDILRSTDNGVTFSSIGMRSPTIFWKSLAVARSDPKRVYVTGYEVANAGGPITHVLTTDNGGESWTELPVTTLAPILLVAAVDPANPRTVFLRSGALSSSDHLYRSIDAGATFTEVLVTTEPIHDVLVKGSTVVVATETGAVFRSDSGGAAFAPDPDAPRLGCLGTQADGTVIGCAGNFDPDNMAVGRSTDAAQWQKVLRFSELAGPLACPPGTVTHDVCEVELWPVLQQQFSVTGPTEGPCAVAQPDGAPAQGGGCCEAGGASPIALAWLSLATLWMIGRRRRKS